MMMAKHKSKSLNRHMSLTQKQPLSLARITKLMHQTDKKKLKLKTLMPISLYHLPPKDPQIWDD